LAPLSPSPSTPPSRSLPPGAAARPGRAGHRDRGGRPPAPTRRRRVPGRGTVPRVVHVGLVRWERHESPRGPADGGTDPGQPHAQIGTAHVSTPLTYPS